MPLKTGIPGEDWLLQGLLLRLSSECERPFSGEWTSVTSVHHVENSDKGTYKTHPPHSVQVELQKGMSDYNRSGVRPRAVGKKRLNWQ